MINHLVTSDESVGLVSRCREHLILLKYRDEILELPLRLSTNIMEGRVKLLETRFIPNFNEFADFIQYYRLR